MVQLAWSGTNGEDEEEEVIPSSVDILKRPDCMDDILALATAMCGLGPEYAQFFWSKSSSTSTSTSTTSPAGGGGATAGVSSELGSSTHVEWVPSR